MKPLCLFPLMLLLSCSTDLPDLAITTRSLNYISYTPDIGCSGESVTVTFDNGYNNNCGSSRIQQRINNVWTLVKESIPQNGIIQYTFIPQAPGMYRFRASWNKTGKDCHGENIRPVEEGPLEVIDNCCRDYFTVKSICNSGRDCPYGLELRFMTSTDNWISITGKLPLGYEFCGLYDEQGLIIEEYSGNVMMITADFYACKEVLFYAYFNAPVSPQSFGSWTVKDMQEVLYQVEAVGCFL